MTIFRLQWCAICLFLAFSSVARASSLLDDLSPAQQAKVKGGEQVFVTEDVAGNAWPRARVYRLVDATPEEMAAVFFDFNKAKGYIPNLLKSEICNKVAPNVVDVDYGLDIPILPDEYYTTRNTLTALPDG